MVKADAIVIEWEVTQILWWWDYEIQPDWMDIKVKAKLAGKMKMHKIRIILWDWVQVELNEYDPSVGRIVYRFKDRNKR